MIISNIQRRISRLDKAVMKRNCYRYTSTSETGNPGPAEPGELN